MILSNDGLVAFHYGSYGTFFYIKIGSIIFIGGYPLQILWSLFIALNTKKERTKCLLTRP